MKVRVITVPLQVSSHADDPLESLQKEYEITRYDHYLVQLAEGPALTVVASVRERDLDPSQKSNNSRRHRDEIISSLSPDERDRFERLRTQRRLLAAEAGLPVYAIATNAQLAEIATMAEPSLNKLRSIPGLGTQKVARFGEALLNVLAHSDDPVTEGENDDG